MQDLEYAQRIQGEQFHQFQKQLVKEQQEQQQEQRLPQHPQVCGCECECVLGMGG